MTNLIQRLILLFMARRGVPVDLSAILQARGIGAHRSQSQQNSARQLMQRLIGRDLVILERRTGDRKIYFSLTPSGAELAQKFEAYLRRLDSARHEMEGVLGLVAAGSVPPAIHAPSRAQSSVPVTLARRVFACRGCESVVTADNLRRQLQRAKKFVCDTCGLEQTEDARDFLEPLAEK